MDDYAETFELQYRNANDAQWTTFEPFDTAKAAGDRWEYAVKTERANRSRCAWRVRRVAATTLMQG